MQEPESAAKLRPPTTLAEAFARHVCESCGTELDYAVAELTNPRGAFAAHWLGEDAQGNVIWVWAYCCAACDWEHDGHGDPPTARDCTHAVVLAALDRLNARVNAILSETVCPGCFAVVPFERLDAKPAPWGADDWNLPGRYAQWVNQAGAPGWRVVCMCGCEDSGLGPPPTVADNIPRNLRDAVESRLAEKPGTHSDEKTSPVGG